MGQLEAILAAAESEVGYLEKKSAAQLDDKTANAGSGNYTKYWRDLAPSFQGSAWCYCFIIWCARVVHISADILPTFFSCSEGVAWFKSRGQWIARSAGARPGDLIFFSDGKSAPAHVGLVTRAGSVLETIEGNTSSGAGVVANGGAVAAKSYAASYTRILGFGRPKYIEEDEKVTYEDFKILADKYLKELAAGEANKSPKEFEAAIVAGITDGTAPRRFATREEAAVMTYRAFNKAAGR
jgi:hypothetical protein